jgi:hypothetical protein
MVVAWGDNRFGQSTVPTNLAGVIALAAGEVHSLALKSNGTVVAWGDNRFGQSTVPANLTGVMALAAGNSHSLAVKSDGTVVAWGDNYFGESTVPTNLTGVISISAGYLHSLALKSDGTVVAWGGNDSGAITVPANITGVVAIAGGYFYSLALVEIRPPPALSISLTTTNVLVAWPAAALGYRLEVTASLSPPVRWNSVTTIANVVSNRYELTLPIGNRAQFFRLINP